MRRGVDTSFLVGLAVLGHSEHAKVQSCFDSVLAAGDALVLAPEILAEFIHVATDGKRFAKPLSTEEALRKATEYWSAVETEKLYPSDEAVKLFLAWMAKFRLGRKRVLDTHFGAMLRTAEVRSILTLNPSDFRIFGCFEFHPDLA